MKYINTDKAPAAIGPYSQAIELDKIVFMSGQIALDPISMEITKGGVISETKQVLKNIDAIVSELGLSKNNIAKTTIFLQDLKDFDIVNKEYEEYFENHKPARSCVEVKRLPKDALIEIECIVVR